MGRRSSASACRCLPPSPGDPGRIPCDVDHTQAVQCRGDKSLRHDPEKSLLGPGKARLRPPSPCPRHPQSRESGTSAHATAADQSVAGGDCYGSSRPVRNYFGIRTVSMTWMTPLSQMMSAVTTVAPPTWTLPSATLISTDWPFTVAADVIFITSAARCLPAMT